MSPSVESRASPDAVARSCLGLVTCPLSGGRFERAEDLTGLGVYETAKRLIARVQGVGSHTGIPAQPDSCSPSGVCLALRTSPHVSCPPGIRFQRQDRRGANTRSTSAEPRRPTPFPMLRVVRASYLRFFGLAWQETPASTGWNL